MPQQHTPLFQRGGEEPALTTYQETSGYYEGYPADYQKTDPLILEL